MCAQFILLSKASAIVSALETAVRSLGPQDRWVKRVQDLKGRLDPEQKWENRALPYLRAPILRLTGESLQLELFQFSLVPSWSKEKRVKFSTHNARLVTRDEKTGADAWIFQKPTWKAPFLKRHCLVPMTGFYEAVYEGPHSGHLVQFHPTAPGEILFAGGLWEEWHSPLDGEVIQSFTILTDDPIPFVKENGHDRSPLFLRLPEALQWLENYPTHPEESVKFLRASQAQPSLGVIRDRELKSAGKKKGAQA